MTGIHFPERDRIPLEALAIYDTIRLLEEKRMELFEEWRKAEYGYGFPFLDAGRVLQHAAIHLLEARLT